MAKTLCIYHANCADGLGAAWAVHRALGADVEFVAAKYGDQYKLLTSAECVASGKCPSQEDIPRACMICDGGLGYCKKCYRAEIELDQPCGIPSIIGRDVLIVDFSYPLAALRAMAQVARSVLVIDHHKTAQEDLRPICGLITEKLPWSGNNSWLEKETWPEGMLELAAIFDMNRSGAGLTWDYLHPNLPRPCIIDLIEDRDLWKFRFGDETREFHAVLTSYDITDLPAMFERLDRWDAGLWETICNEGMAILRAQRQAVEAAVTASRRTMKIAAHTVPCANMPPSMASDAGHLLCEQLIYTDPRNHQYNRPPLFSATYYDGADGKRHFSLRSPEGGADVGHIAKAMAEKFNNNQFEKYRGTAWSGGGHEHAAGFDAPLGWEGE